MKIITGQTAFFCGLLQTHSS